MIGRILGGRYEILEKIGEGGMAVVYKAKCHLLNRFVAIKILKEEFIDDNDFIRKFKRESQAAASLSHPNILNIYDVGNEECNNKNYPYIVMEYIEGKTLKDLIKEGGKLTIDEAIHYGIQIAEAIKHAHMNNIIHRDIKPQNMMVTRDNRVKVTDFGIARAATTSTLTTTSNVLGSVHYFSPEQARGGYTDERSDIYSLGIVIYEMITGKLPYDGENLISVALKHVQEDMVPPREIDSNIPVGLESIILKCVQKNQSDRYSDISSLINDLENIDKTIGENDHNDDSEDAFQTRIIPAINVDTENPQDARVGTKSRRRKASNRKIIFSAVILAFLLVGSIFLVSFKLKGLFKSEEIVVPYIVGMDQEKAREEIEKLGLRFNIKDYVKSNEYAPGEITFQSVEAKGKVKKGFIIEVIVSEGQDLVRVPGLVNITLADAEELLEDRGLSIGSVNYKPSDTTPKDLIMKQEPDANTYLEPGSKVNVIVSQGEEIKSVLMPRLINENIYDAQNTLLSLGLTIGEIIPNSSETVAKDKVIWQSYEPGTELKSKTVVDLYVSTGPEKKPDPETPPENDGTPPDNGSSNENNPPINGSNNDSSEQGDNTD